MLTFQIIKPWQNAVTQIFKFIAYLTCLLQSFQITILNLFILFFSSFSHESYFDQILSIRLFFVSKKITYINWQSEWYSILYWHRQPTRTSLPPPQNTIHTLSLHHLIFCKKKPATTRNVEMSSWKNFFLIIKTDDDNKYDEQKNMIQKCNKMDSWLNWNKNDVHRFIYIKYI